MLPNYQPHSNIPDNSSLNQMISDQISPSHFRGLLNLVTDSNNINQQISQNHQLTKQSTRKTINKWLFILFCNIFFLLGFNLWLLVFVEIPIQQLNSILFSIQSIFSSAICAIVIYQISPSFKQAYRLLLLPDDIFLNTLLTSIAFTHQIIIMDYNNAWDLKLYIPFYFLEAIFIVTSIKCTLLYLKWAKIQVIIMKFIFMFLAITFFSFGVYYILTRQSFVEIQDPNVMQTMNKYHILYSFSAFNHFLEIYKKFSTFDGTDHLRYDYVFINLNSEKENTIIKQKFIRVKRQTSNTLFMMNNFNLNKNRKSNSIQHVIFHDNNPGKNQQEHHKKGETSEANQNEEKKQEVLNNIFEEDKEQSEINVQKQFGNENSQQKSKGYTITEKPLAIKSFRVLLKKRSCIPNKKNDDTA